MRRTLKAIVVSMLAGAFIAAALTPPAFAAKSGGRYYQHPQGKVSVPCYGARYYRCNGGRHYTFLGGWGCDYYRYTYDWPLGRR